jgi:hypothetical protein
MKTRERELWCQENIIIIIIIAGVYERRRAANGQAIAVERRAFQSIILCCDGKEYIGNTAARASSKGK